MEHRLISEPTTLTSRRILLATFAMAAMSFGWSASGTVKSSGGAALAGVTVVRADSTAHKTTTDANGGFTMEFTSGVQDRMFRDNSPGIRVEGDEIVVQVPADGPVGLSLLDASGRVSWSSVAQATNGVARASLPVGQGRQALWLRVQHAQGVFEQAVLTGGDRLRVAPHVAAARAMATFPVLKFSKAGYRDTTHAMASASETNLAIVMADTTHAPTTCPAAKLSAGDQTKTISVKGVSRTYILHVPSGYTGATPVPLLVDYHPIGGSASGQESGTQYKSLVDADGGISVYPNGLASPNMGQAWDVKGCCTTADDTAFARALVAEVKTLACINPKRVYAAGFSMGGGMTHFTACHLADIFAAAAPAAFDLLKENVDICKPARPITMVIFRGTADNVVPYAGGYSNVVSGMAINFLGAKATAAKWAELDKCTGSASAEDANGCSTYSNCADGVQVTLCTKQGGGHEQGIGSIGWPILKKYTLP